MIGEGIYRLAALPVPPPTLSDHCREHKALASTRESSMSLILSWASHRLLRERCRLSNAS